MGRILINKGGTERYKTKPFADNDDDEDDDGNEAPDYVPRGLHEWTAYTAAGGGYAIHIQQSTSI